MTPLQGGGYVDHHGGAVVQLNLESARLHRLKLKHDELLSTFAFKFNLRPYTMCVMYCIVQFGKTALISAISVAEPDIHCSPRHRLPFNSRNEGSQCVG